MGASNTGSCSCGIPNTSMSMSLDGCSLSRSRTHPPTTSARPPAAAAASAMRRVVLSETSAEDTPELSFARVQQKAQAAAWPFVETGCVDARSALPVSYARYDEDYATRR